MGTLLRHGRLVKLEGKIKSAKYQEILEKNVFPSARELQVLRTFIFQQENNLEHPAKGIQKWFEDSKADALERLSKNSDLSPIERL